MKFKCPRCGRKLQVERKDSCEVVRCTKCGIRLVPAEEVYPK